MVTLCGTGEGLGKPLSQLVVSLKVQGPAQLSVTWWKRRHRSPAAEGGCPEQEARPQQKPSGGVSPVRCAAFSSLLLWRLLWAEQQNETQRALILVLRGMGLGAAVQPGEACEIPLGKSLVCAALSLKHRSCWKVPGELAKSRRV